MLDALRILNNRRKEHCHLRSRIDFYRHYFTSVTNMTFSRSLNNTLTTCIVFSLVVSIKCLNPTKIRGFGSRNLRGEEEMETILGIF